MSYYIYQASQPVSLAYTQSWNSKPATTFSCTIFKTFVYWISNFLSQEPQHFYSASENIKSKHTCNLQSSGHLKGRLHSIQPDYFLTTCLSAKFVNAATLKIYQVYFHRVLNHLSKCRHQIACLKADWKYWKWCMENLKNWNSSNPWSIFL